MQSSIPSGMVAAVEVRSKPDVVDARDGDHVVDVVDYLGVVGFRQFGDLLIVEFVDFSQGVLEAVGLCRMVLFSPLSIFDLLLVDGVLRNAIRLADERYLVVDSNDASIVGNGPDLVVLQVTGSGADGLG